MNPVFRDPDFDRIEIGVDETKGAHLDGTTQKP
jgi:hypothetical protein